MEVRGPNKNIPREFLEGFALTFVRSLCRSEDSDSIKRVMVSSPGEHSRKAKDAIARLDHSEVKNSDSANLIKTYRVILGLASQESDGKISKSKDPDNGSRSPETFEAGAYQVSATSQAALTDPLIQQYFISLNSTRGDIAAMENICLLKKYSYTPSDRTHLSAKFSRLHGLAQKISANPGQRVSTQAFSEAMKICPALATEYVAVVARTNKQHFGPLARSEVDGGAGCAQLLRDIENLVRPESYFGVCRSLADPIVQLTKLNSAKF